MSQPPSEEAQLSASSDHDSEADVDMVHANEHSESASFLKAFMYGRLGPPYEEHHALSVDTRTSRRSRMVTWGFALAPWVLSLVLLAALVSERVGGETASHQGAKGPYMLAEDHMEYRTELMYDGVDNRNPMSEFQGWPNEENDKLWDQFDGAMMRITREEAEKLPHLSQHVALEAHKDEFVVGVTFTHTMHCLSSLRKKMYPGRYHHTSWIDEHGNFTYERWWHTDHCIEMLRRYITCHADTTAFTYDWIEDSSILVHPGTPHTCKNFDRVMEWVEDHRVSVPLRQHVEGDRIVDYEGKPMGPAWAAVEMNAPKGWKYNKKEVYDQDVPALSQGGT